MCVARRCGGLLVWDSLKPPRTPAVTAPAFRVSDGAHPGTGSNPDFFFLPPMVPDPSGNANFDRGGSNARLLPTVDICEVNATTEQQVNAGAPCKGGGYFLSMTLGPSQIQPDDASTDLGGSHYSSTGRCHDRRCRSSGSRFALSQRRLVLPTSRWSRTARRSRT